MSQISLSDNSVYKVTAYLNKLREGNKSLNIYFIKLFLNFKNYKLKLFTVMGQRNISMYKNLISVKFEPMAFKKATDLNHVSNLANFEFTDSIFLDIKCRMEKNIHSHIVDGHNEIRQLPVYINFFNCVKPHDECLLYMNIVPSR